MPNRPTVLVTRHLPRPVLDRLGGACELDLWDEDRAMPRDALLARAAGRDGLLTLLTDRVDAELLDAAGPDLRVVANYAVGYDNVDVEVCTARGVLVTNTPDVVTGATADLTWALLLAAARRVADGDRFLRAGTPWAWGPEMMLGREVNGKVLGIVGLGRIGRAVARRAAGFDMRLLYASASGRRLEGEEEAALGVAWRDLDDLLAEADFVSVHTALTPRTRHLIGPAELARMKPTAVLVNTARGPIVDEAALAAALREGRIGAAGIDVFEREPEVHPDLRTATNAVIVPHLGTATIETRTAMGMLAVDNLLAVFEGRPPPSPVNPEVAGLDRG